MFARTIVRRQAHNYGDILEKTAKHTVGSAGATSKSILVFVSIIAFPCFGFVLNLAYPSTRKVTECYGYGGVDMEKNKNALWQEKK